MGRSNDHDQTTRLKTVLATKVVKRSVMLSGHATSVSLEQPFWDILNRIAEERGLPMGSMIAEIDTLRSTNLSSALRLYALDYIKKAGV